MTTFDLKQQHLLRRKDEKLPLAIFIYYNFYLSVVFAILIGRLVLRNLEYDNFKSSFERSLLLPTYCIWLLAEIPRLYVGQKGVLRDKLPEMAAFLLLSFFPQIWIALYTSYLQQTMVDKVLGTLMLVFIVVELVLAWRFLRSIITRQSVLHYQRVGSSRSEMNNLPLKVEYK